MTLGEVTLTTFKSTCLATFLVLPVMANPVSKLDWPSLEARQNPSNRSPRHVFKLTVFSSRNRIFPVKQVLDRLARKHGLVFRHGDQCIVPPEAFSLRKILPMLAEPFRWSKAL